MEHCIRCSNDVPKLMKSTGTCLKCRNEEIELAQYSDEDIRQVRWLKQMERAINKNKEPETTEVRLCGSFHDVKGELVYEGKVIA